MLYGLLKEVCLCRQLKLTSPSYIVDDLLNFQLSSCSEDYIMNNKLIQHNETYITDIKGVTNFEQK